MYFQQSEHNPLHIHVIYGEYIGIVDIIDITMIEGDLPTRALEITKEWIKIYQKELIDMWNTQKFKKLPPLR